MDEEKTDTENTGAEESKPEETTEAETKTEEAPAAEESKTEEAPAAEESNTEEAPAAEESNTEEAPAAEESKIEEAPAAEESKTEEAPAAEESKTEETPAETATAEAAPVSDDGGDAKVTVPGFLKVLGILSFIGCGLQLLGNVFSIGSLSGMIGVVSAVACFWGVLQMWKLKKMGFYIYAAFEILPVIYALVSVGTAAFSLGAIGGGIMAIFATLAMFFPVLFIILYGLNLKHMK